MEGEKEEQKRNKIGVTIENTDIFETEDLPEDDQQLIKDHSNETTELVENVESGRLDVKEAFKLFIDKRIDCLNTDFSDSIATQKIGYESSEREEERESIEEKYTRLKKSIEDLKQEILLLQTKGKDESDDHINDLMAKVEHLRGMFGEEASHLERHNLDGDKGSIDGRKLISDLDSFLTTTTNQQQQQQQQQQQNDVTTYELFCNDNSGTDQLLLTKLEQRLQKCEAAVGNTKTIALHASENPSKTILGALSLVVARFTLLDYSQLTHFETSLLAIHQKVLQASAKSDASDIADKVDQLDGLYESLKKWDSLGNAVPHMVDRLLVMKDWHAQATQFSKALKQISNSQNRLLDDLQNQSDKLKQIQALAGPQMQLFESNCQHIESLFN